MTRAVATGLAVGLAVALGTAPASASPGQERGNGVATLVLRDVELRGVSISGAVDPDSGPDGGAVPVVRLRVGSIGRAASLDLARPVPDGSLRVAGTGVDGDDVVLDATWACVRGLGVTGLGLLSGALDGPLNDVLAVDPGEGFRPSWVVGLANLIGLTPVPLVVDELRAEVAALDADAFALAGARVVRDARVLPPLGACGEPDAPPVAPVAPEEALADLRPVPELADLPPAAELTPPA